MRQVGLYIIIFIVSYPIHGQNYICNQLNLKDGKYYENGTLFTGVCTYRNATDLLIRLNIRNGLLHGDSAFTKFYNNGLCHTNVSYSYGIALDTISHDYYELVALFAGYAQREMANRDSLIRNSKMQIGIRKLSEIEIQLSRRNSFIFDKTVDTESYKIIQYTLSGGGICYGGALRDAVCKNNNISEFLLFLLKDERKEKYTFFDIYYTAGTDTLKLSNLTLNIK